SAQRTKCAEARACNPFLLTMTRSLETKGSPACECGWSAGSIARLLAVEYLAGDIDVLAAGVLRVGDCIEQSLLAPDTRQLDEHRQVYPGDHLGLARFHHGNREVRRRSPEHVGKHDHARTGFDP